MLQIIRKAEIWISPDLLHEYRQVPLQLESERKINHEQLKNLIECIASFILNAKTAYPSKSISICRDEEDNMILECCLEAKAEYLITGDKDLLEIDRIILNSAGLKNLLIVSPRDFFYLKH